MYRNVQNTGPCTFCRGQHMRCLTLLVPNSLRQCLSLDPKAHPLSWAACQVSFRTLFSSAGAAVMYSHAWLLTWLPRIWTRVLVLANETVLPTEPSLELLLGMFKFNFLIFLNVLGSHVTGTPYCQHSTFPRDKSQVSCFCATVYQWLAHRDTQDKNVTIGDKRKGSQWPCLPPGGVSSDESCSPRGFLPLSIIKAFGLNIFQLLNTLIFIFFFFPSRQFRKGNRSFIYFKLENFQREKNPKGHPTPRLPQGGSVPGPSLLFLAASGEVSSNFYPEST